MRIRPKQSIGNGRVLNPSDAEFCKRNFGRRLYYESVAFGHMRKKLSTPIIVLALVVYFFRSQITTFLGHDLSKVSFLGVPILTDWGSLLLILIFGLDLVVSGYGAFMNVPHLSMRIRDEERRDWRIAAPVTIIDNQGNSQGQATMHVLYVKVHNRGPTIAEGCRAFCKMLTDKDKPSIEVRWRMIPPPFGATEPRLDVARIPEAIQNLFETGPSDIVPFIETSLTIGFTITGAANGAYLMGAHHFYDLGNFPVRKDVELSVTGRNVTKPIFVKCKLTINSANEIQFRRFTWFELFGDSFAFLKHSESMSATGSAPQP